jgi:probable HAF family extracellular repeat protein
VTDLGTLGGSWSDGNAINHRGQVVGESALSGDSQERAYFWAGGNLHVLVDGWAYDINDLGQVPGFDGQAFLWSRGAGVTDLGFEGKPYGINNLGQLAGQMYGNSPHAFLWTKDSGLSDLGTLSGQGVSGANDIDNLGEVVGQSATTGAPHAFLWTQPGGMKDLGTLDGNTNSTSGANAINDSGQIVGSSFSYTLGVTHAAYFTPSGVVDLGSLGGYSWATDVNSTGQVVGYGAGGPFLTDLASMHMVSLNTLIPPDSGWVLGTATSISDTGRIVGVGSIHGHSHGYLLTPTNSPPSVLRTAVPGRASALPAPVVLTPVDRRGPVAFLSAEQPGPVTAVLNDLSPPLAAALGAARLPRDTAWDTYLENPAALPLA